MDEAAAAEAIQRLPALERFATGRLVKRMLVTNSTNIARQLERNGVEATVLLSSTRILLNGFVPLAVLAGIVCAFADVRTLENACWIVTFALIVVAFARFLTVIGPRRRFKQEHPRADTSN